jgi:hypothetical protein
MEPQSDDAKAKHRRKPREAWLVEVDKYGWAECLGHERHAHFDKAILFREVVGVHPPHLNLPDEEDTEL